MATWIDQRIRTTEVNAEQALTRDTVPVNVDAIVFWMVHDAERAALEIADYISAVQRVAQTSLREMIGSSVLSELLSDRKSADAALKEVIGAKTAEWGVTVNSVEIRDVAIPDNLQDAMSRQAQAEREKQARVTLGAAEEGVAHKFVNAARLYATNPEALQLRAMNTIYETTKERGATILMPDAMVDAMNPAPRPLRSTGAKAVRPDGTRIPISRAERPGRQASQPHSPALYCVGDNICDKRSAKACNGTPTARAFPHLEGREPAMWGPPPEAVVFSNGGFRTRRRTCPRKATRNVPPK